ncbi:MAG: lysine--tRNA ligase [Patescibacteria group bacterium]|nr:lysine--tRNA ligase [Patescibacteria group bacterium]MDD5164896.1 lysine--tRNA ligase [Patescibacteria group bacterium]MDD5534616.1 lysine--tRNA ligase [Patescibacteria group bacterium]
MINEEQSRIEKLEKIKSSQVNPYPALSERSHTVKQAIDDFDKLSEKETLVILVGRLVLLRLHGKACFANLEDGTGRFQIFFAQDNVGEKEYQFFTENIDVGDFLEIKGHLFITKRGEKTIKATSWKLLSKALLPLPEKWHGLSDVETRYRQRYLDLIANQEVKDIFVKRTKMIKLIRDFFNLRDYMEVSTPVLQGIAGGAIARPFVTHNHALDIDLYLRIAPELYLKRLIIGGFERVYEIAKCFRNEGIDASHNPEFTQIEFYQSYADYNVLMRLTEELFEYLLSNLEGKLTIEYQNNTLNFKSPYPRLEFRQAIKNETGLDIEEYRDLKGLIEQVKKLGITVEKSWDRGKILDELFKERVRPKLINPTFLIHHPIELSPLAKKCPDNPNYVERFQLLVAGMEICNAFSELNDPLDQESRFNEQDKLREKGDQEAQGLDEDFVKALKYGMPPTAGEGIGIDRLALILTNTCNIREVILFPILRPKSEK